MRSARDSTSDLHNVHVTRQVATIRISSSQALVFLSVWGRTSMMGMSKITKKLLTFSLFYGECGSNKLMMSLLIYITFFYDVSPSRLFVARSMILWLRFENDDVTKARCSFSVDHVHQSIQILFHATGQRSVINSLLDRRLSGILSLSYLRRQSLEEFVTTLNTDTMAPHWFLINFQFLIWWNLFSIQINIFPLWWDLLYLCKRSISI